MRETDEGQCTGCGECIEICPVNALRIDGDYPVVDEEWCIGCGVCGPKCPTGAVKLRLRNDIDQVPAPTFKELYTKILQEKGLK